MKILRIYMIVLLYFIVSSCSLSQKDIKPTTYSKDDALHIEQELLQKTDYRLFINKHKTLELYEPKSRCYIGAYILSNPDLNFEISTFEEITEKSHGIYLRNFKLGKPFPIDWVLECISKMKTPFIILQPPSIHYPYQDFLLEECAKEFGEYYIPIFVQFYPNPQQYESAQEYKDFFIKARNTFKKYAPNVAFVWSVNNENVKDAMLYYPGDEVVDWVGINVYDTIKGEEEKNKNSIFEAIDFFYFLFQDRKPIMISQLGISHYSKYDHGYYIEEAAKTINTVYNKIQVYYPAIKAINYMDFDNIEVAPEGMGYDNFKITSHKNLTESYRSVVKNQYYIDSLDIQNVGKNEDYWFVSYYSLYKKDGFFYISDKVLKHEWDLEISDLNEDAIIVIKGYTYYSLEELVKGNGVSILIDHENKIVKIQ